MSTLFEPFDLGPLKLTNRIVMAPMTRTRTSEGVLHTDGDLPNELTVKYYKQRSSAGLMISETNDVDQSSHGYAHIPGIHSEAQKQAWRPVAEEVDRQGGTIFMQIWHVGRLAHSSLLPNGQAPVGVTSERAVGSEVYAHGPDGRLRFLAADTPRPLSTDEVAAMICTFAKAAANAKEAGFDGVEIHGANGYLIDQFLNSILNTRDDRYGGSTKEDRSRFLMEIVDAVVAIFGPGRVGVRLSPFGKYGSMPSDPLAEETFLYVVGELGRRGIAYIHVLYELLPSGNTEAATFETSHLDHGMLAQARKAFPGAIIWCGGFVSAEGAQAALDTGLVDMIAFGRPFIANPDLVDRLRNDWPLAVADRDVYYTRNGEVGYTDFPTYAEESAAERDGVVAFTADFTARMISVNGTRLFVRVGGRGPAVVLLHGFADTGDMWAPTANDLMRDHLVIVPDLRGMGLSDHPETGYDKRTQAEDLAGILDVFQASKAHLVTHDLGNMVGFAFASTHQGRVDKFVLIDAPIPGVGPWEEMLLNPKLWHFHFGGPDMERLVAGRERIYLDHFWNGFAADPRSIGERTRQHYAALYARPGGMRSAFAQFLAMDQDAFDNRAWLAAGDKLGMPIYAIGGERSFGSTIATIMRFAAEDVKEGIVPRAGHWIMEENPSATTAMVRAFLAGGT